MGTLPRSPNSSPSPPEAPDEARTGNPRTAPLGRFPRTDLLKVAQRHKVDHGIYHVAQDLARWSQAHVRELVAVGRRYELHLSDKTGDGNGLLSGVREKASELLVHYLQPGLLLLADLRRLHRTGRSVPGLGTARSSWSSSQRQ